MGFCLRGADAGDDSRTTGPRRHRVRRSSTRTTRCGCGGSSSPPARRAPIHRHELDHLLIQVAGDRIAVIPEPDTEGPYTEELAADVVPGAVVHVAKGGVERARNVGDQALPRDHRRAEAPTRTRQSLRSRVGNVTPVYGPGRYGVPGRSALAGTRVSGLPTIRNTAAASLRATSRKAGSDFQPCVPFGPRHDRRELKVSAVHRPHPRRTRILRHRSTVVLIGSTSPPGSWSPARTARQHRESSAAILTADTLAAQRSTGSVEDNRGYCVSDHQHRHQDDDDGGERRRTPPTGVHAAWSGPRRQHPRPMRRPGARRTPPRPSPATRRRSDGRDRFRSTRLPSRRRQEPGPAPAGQCQCGRHHGEHQGRCCVVQVHDEDVRAPRC